MSDATRRPGVALLESARRARAGSPAENEGEYQASPAREPGTTEASDLAVAIPALLPRLWRFALRLAGDRHEAEDLVQRACVRALERRHQLRPGTATLSWLFSIVHSIWLNEVRARKIRSHGRMQWSEGLAEKVADPLAADPETAVLHREIVSAVERLPDLQRAVMLLVAVEGMSYREAATVLDVPIGTVMSRLARARLTIAEVFGNRSAQNQSGASGP
jgi:RNA polymerase sigma-70 factor (ECF subfamily)